MKIRLQSHTAYRLLYHVVWIPKYRRKIFKPGVGAFCTLVIKNYVKNGYPDVQVEDINIQPDHVHLLITIPPKYSIANVIGRIKSYSSKVMRNKFDYLRRGNESMWSVGYFVSSVGLDESTIRKYVEYQGKQDKGQAELVTE